MKITSYAVHRQLATSAILIALMVLGAYGLYRLPVDYLPSITYPLVRVQIKWPGATPEEINTDIADPVERFIATVDRLDYIESSSVEGIYALDVYFQYGANIDIAFQDVLAALTRAQQKLPEDITAPYVDKADPSQLPVMQLTISSANWNPVILRDWADNWLQDRILAVSGVAGTEVIGGLKREIRVLLDPPAMEKHQLSLDGIIKRIDEENIDQTGGRVTVGSKEIIARTIGEYASVADVENVVVAADGYQKVYLRDIADVVDGHEEARLLTRFNGKECVKISVLKEAEANTVAVAESVNQLLQELTPFLPEGITLSYVEDQAVYVKQSLLSVRNAAIAAAALLIIVIYLFLGSFRQVFIMVGTLGATLVLNFGLMQFAGFSLNILSLGGLVIAIGVVLDNSIIVVENISRLKQQTPAVSSRENAITATNEVGSALIAATLSFMALFVPFLFVPGLTSLLFRELILVIAGVVCISLGIAVSVTPMISAALFQKDKANRQGSWFERFFSRITNGYKRLLTLVIAWRWVTIAVFVFTLVVGLSFMGRLGGQFLPLIDDGRVMIKVKMPTGASVQETDRVLRKIEKAIADDPLIQSRFTLVGGQVRGLTTYEIANEGGIDIQLISKADRDISTEEYVAGLRKVIGKLQPPGGKAMARQMPIKGIRGNRSPDIELEIRGQDMDTLQKIAYQTAQTLNANERFQNVLLSMDLSKPEYQIRVDREKAAELGISVSDVADAMKTLITGAVATRYKDGSEYYDMRVLVPQQRLDTRLQVENLPLIRMQGAPLRLRDIASVEQASGPVEIVRKNQVKQITIEADVTDNDLAGTVRTLKQEMSGINMPPGYEFDIGGRADMMADMKQTTSLILVFALFFAFIVLTVQFNSLKLPSLILGSVPVCLAGVVLILFFTNIPLGATVVIGVLVVIAATVNDGVLLLTFASELNEKPGMTTAEAIIDAASIRLRPRIMTTVTTMVGFIPLALNIEEGGDMLQPMAVAAIGGLGMEMLVALFLMPCLYVMLTRNYRR